MCLLLPLLVFASAGATAAAPAARGGAPAGSCSARTATTLSVSWAEEPETDMYYVQLSDPQGPADARPYALQTTPSASLTLNDLVPDTEYTLSVRSHPSQFNIVWGWRPASPSFKCRTAPERADAPSQPQRVGNSPHVSEIALQWRPAQTASAATTTPHSVGVRRAAPDSASGSGWRWEPADSPTAHTARNLSSGERYEVAVRDDLSGVVSESLLMRTASPGVLYTNAYRISEYTFDGATRPLPPFPHASLLSAASQLVVPRGILCSAAERLCVLRCLCSGLSGQS